MLLTLSTGLVSRTSTYEVELEELFDDFVEVDDAEVLALAAAGSLVVEPTFSEPVFSEPAFSEPDFSAGARDSFAAADFSDAERESVR